MAQDRNQLLSLAFMQSHPAQAARVLEGLSAEDGAALFSRTPARVSALVLEAMLPQRAAQCLGALSDERALALLKPMATQPTVAVLRYVPGTRRRDLVTGLPAAAALASSLLLGYSEDTLGAWANPDIIILPAETRVAEAIAKVRETSAAHSQIFVTDSDRRLSGVVEMPALLRAPAEASLATVMAPPVAVLAANAPLSGTPSHPGWERSSMLPVVEPGERLVGVLSRDALARALRRSRELKSTEAQIPLPGMAARNYWLALSGLIESSLPLLPKIQPVGEQPKP